MTGEGLEKHRRTPPRNPIASRMLLWAARRRVRKLGRLIGLILGSDFNCRNFGKGLYLPHPYGLVVHSGVRIGDRCRIFQHVTIGEHNEKFGVAVIEDDVFIGAGAVILGPVHIGAGATVGANAVVVNDVPSKSTAVGIPARVIRAGRTE